MSEVKVEQVDREAAASYYEATKSHRTDDHIVKLIRHGDHAHAMVAAFARHRIEATRALSAEVEALRAMLLQAHDTMHECTAVLSANDCATVAAVMAEVRALLNKEPAR